MAIVLLTTAAAAPAAKLLLDDGRTLDGRFASVATVAEDPMNPKRSAGGVQVTPLLVVDDGLRRTFIHKTKVRQVLEEASERPVTIKVWQDVAKSGDRIGRLGRPVSVAPFDEYGRRTVEINTSAGLVAVVQGITEITPLYTKVEGLAGIPQPIVWDLRIATSSIPAETLRKILATTIPQDDLEARLQVVRFYTESERYYEAEQELARVATDFSELQDLDRELRQLRQLSARVILDEIQLREAAGQHQFAKRLLENFPPDGVAGETLERVRELIQQYETNDQQRQELLATLDTQISQIPNPNSRTLAEEFGREITEELNDDTIGRLAAFRQLSDAEGLSAEQRVALAVSGWLVGANEATDNFHVAVSLAQVRKQVRQFLAEPDSVERHRMLIEMGAMEGATVQRVAQLLKLMKPPLPLPKAAEQGPGAYELTVPGMKEGEQIRYVVQLPPEYDPLRYYPTIVTLSDAGISAEQQLDFWAGAAREGDGRIGQATRRGYITIAVDWLRPKQTGYEFSLREHHAVLSSLRDACRRLSIDTDRVYITGHGIGGDAIWDIALSHPDLWAGVLPITAVADKYVARYWENGQYVPWYLVAGELDGDKTAINSRELDRYLRPSFDAAFVEYLGRGYEPLNDEIQRMFDWMEHRRRTLPTEFEATTMRPWDNFFWWLEIDGLPEKLSVLPSQWPPARGVRPMTVRCRLVEGNKVYFHARTDRVTVWLGPELVDFNEPMEIELNGRRISPRDRYVTPELSVLLEDVRTRADRHHPFWAKLEEGED